METREPIPLSSVPSISSTETDESSWLSPKIVKAGNEPVDPMKLRK